LRLAREVYEAHRDGREDVDESQEHLTALRADIEGYPLIPVLKGLVRESTGEESWRNLRPPLSESTDESVRTLLSRLPVPELV